MFALSSLWMAKNQILIAGEVRLRHGKLVLKVLIVEKL
jgi:hypothetical protein